MQNRRSRFFYTCLGITALIALTSASEGSAMSASQTVEKKQKNILAQQKEHDIWFFPVILKNGQPEKTLLVKGGKSWEALQSSHKSVTKKDTVVSRAVALATRQELYKSEREALQQLSLSSDTLWKIITCTARFYDSEQIVHGVMFFAGFTPETIEKFLATRRKKTPNAEWAWVPWSAIKKLKSNDTRQNRLALLQEIKKHQAFRVPGETVLPSGSTQRKLTLNLNPFLAELLRGSIPDDKKPCQKAGKVEAYGIH